MKTVSFAKMEDCTAEDIAWVEEIESKFAADVADRVLAHLKSLETEPTPLQVDRLEHSLQTATHAHRGGADEETVVAALLHDIGDMLAPYNHCELAAAVLRPYVSEKTHWIVKHHGIFQAYYYAHLEGRDRNARDRYREHPYYQDAVDFCHKWDMPAFDPTYESLPLEFFEPMVRRVFAREPFMYDRR